MRKEDLLCCPPIRHCCGGYSEHNNCCPHDNECGDPRDRLCNSCLILHITDELKEQIEKIKSRIAGNEQTITEDYDRLNSAIEDLLERQNNIELLHLQSGNSDGSTISVSIPTRVSQLINDLGYITREELDYAVSNIVPQGDYVTTTQLNESISGLNYITRPELNNILQNYNLSGNYVTVSQLNEILQGYTQSDNYVTTSQLNDILQGYNPVGNYVSQSQLQNAISTITNSGYITATQLNSILQNYSPKGDYITRTQLNEILENLNSGESGGGSNTGGDDPNPGTSDNPGTGENPNPGTGEDPNQGGGDDPNTQGDQPSNGRYNVGNYEVVDLGLPSNTLWATCNVGANSETEYGDYYTWGSGSTVYDATNPYRSLNTASILSSAEDTATQVMGGAWSMPTEQQINELIENTNYSFTTINGVNGGKYTSKTDSNKYVFFPAAGQWDGELRWAGQASQVHSSSSPKDQNSEAGMLASDSTSGRYVTLGRLNGVSVRGVCHKTENSGTGQNTGILSLSQNATQVDMYGDPHISFDVLVNGEPFQVTDGSFTVTSDNNAVYNINATTYTVTALVENNPSEEPRTMHLFVSHNGQTLTYTIYQDGWQADTFGWSIASPKSANITFSIVEDSDNNYDLAGESDKVYKITSNSGTMTADLNVYADTKPYGESYPTAGRIVKSLGEHTLNLNNINNARLYVKGNDVIIENLFLESNNTVSDSEYGTLNHSFGGNWTMVYGGDEDLEWNANQQHPVTIGSSATMNWQYNGGYHEGSGTPFSVSKTVALNLNEDTMTGSITIS